MYKTKGYKFFETYFNSMLPRDQEIDVKDIARMEKIMSDYLISDEGKLAGRNDGFRKELQNGIDSLKRTQSIRQFAEKPVAKPPLY